jgi:hypothetical protein
MLNEKAYLRLASVRPASLQLCPHRGEPRQPFCPHRLSPAGSCTTSVRGELLLRVKLCNQLRLFG